MNQPNRLVLPNGYPGKAYSHEVPINGYQAQPTATARLCYGPGGRLVGPDVPQPTVVVVNDLTNPTYWKARIQFSTALIFSRTAYWLELIVNDDVHSAGPFSVNYQTRP